MEQDIELIENYLNGNLSADESSVVDQRIKTDPQFASRVQILKQSYLALDPEIEAFREELKSIHAETQSQQQFSIWQHKKYLIAASITLISMLFAGYMIWFQAPNPESLYQAYMQIPDNNIAVRGEPDGNQMGLAMEAYDKENYLSALNQLNNILEVAPNNPGALFYSGVSYMAMEQYSDAISTFQGLIELESHEYYTAAQWYLSLSLLKTNQLESAKSQLEQLQQLNQGQYSRKAGELLNKLN